MTDPARMYRESAVRYASPVGLIVILYEEVIRSLRRAHRAYEQNDIEQRCHALTHALLVIGHLHSVLNFENGGEVAQNLSNFYNVARKVILDCNYRGDTRPVVALAADFSNLAEAWQQVDRDLVSSVSEAPPETSTPRISPGQLRRTAPQLRAAR